MKHTLVGLSVVAAAVGCATESPPPAPEASAEPSAAVVPAATSGRGAAERFLATWNTRDPEQWAGSLNYPHARPSAAGYRVWPTRQAYVDTADFARVIATGWDHTCRSHGGPAKRRSRSSRPLSATPFSMPPGCASVRSRSHRNA